ncbi:hypothetical protein Q5P01_000333 [Channa striata]|uniref:Uncharacterized protein n=1 Tax=Channa striata TaxID=64152 RepID=A0AA88IIT6_CHASR|nr:hypothetical protein Q5P01_000333 [Channa striata]
MCRPTRDNLRNRAWLALGTARFTHALAMRAAMPTVTRSVRRARRPPAPLPGRADALFFFAARRSSRRLIAAAGCAKSSWQLLSAGSSPSPPSCTPHRARSDRLESSPPAEDPSHALSRVRPRAAPKGESHRPILAIAPVVQSQSQTFLPLAVRTATRSESPAAHCHGSSKALASSTSSVSASEPPHSARPRNAASLSPPARRRWTRTARRVPGPADLTAAVARSRSENSSAPRLPREGPARRVASGPPRAPCNPARQGRHRGRLRLSDLHRKELFAASCPLRLPILSARFRGKLGAIAVITSLIVGFHHAQQHPVLHRQQARTRIRAVAPSGRRAGRPEYEHARHSRRHSPDHPGLPGHGRSIVLSFFAATSKRKMDDRRRGAEQEHRTVFACLIVMNAELFMSARRWLHGAAVQAADPRRTQAAQHGVRHRRVQHRHLRHVRCHHGPHAHRAQGETRRGPRWQPQGRHRDRHCPKLLPTTASTTAAGAVGILTIRNPAVHVNGERSRCIGHRVGRAIELFRNPPVAIPRVTTPGAENGSSFPVKPKFLPWDGGKGPVGMIDLQMVASIGGHIEVHDTVGHCQHGKPCAIACPSDKDGGASLWPGLVPEDELWWGEEWKDVQIKGESPTMISPGVMIADRLRNPSLAGAGIGTLRDRRGKRRHRYPPIPGGSAKKVRMEIARPYPRLVRPCKHLSRSTVIPVVVGQRTEIQCEGFGASVGACSTAVFWLTSPRSQRRALR